MDSSSFPARTDDVIEAIVQTLCGDMSSAHIRHIYRESLRNLVRLAKAEQLQDMLIRANPAALPGDLRLLH